MTTHAPADAEVSTRQVLALKRMVSAVLLGGSAGLDRSVRSVRIAPEQRHPEGDFRRCAVILDGARLAADTYVVDLTLRWMDDAGAPLLIVVSPAREVSLSARRLADKLRIGLVSLTDSILDVSFELREVVEAPTRVAARTIIEAVDRLSRVSAAQRVEDSLSAIDSTLEGRSAVIAFDGDTVVGAELTPPIEAKNRIAVVVQETRGDTVRLVNPITLAHGESPTFWLVIEAKSPTPAWIEVAERVARVGTRYVATQLISGRLEQERDARARLGALNSIIALTESAGSALLQQLGTLGWTTDGWCTAIHLRVGGAADASRVLALTSDLARSLRGAGCNGPVIERPDGWTTWLTDTAEPQASSFGDLTVRMRRALHSFVERRDGLRVYAGIGHPHSGLAGLKKSLAEAQDAATIAQASGLRTGVQHIDELGVQRILVGWYTSKEFSDFARTLLRPVIEVDREEGLIRTLEVYLDNESSPTATADFLGVHRNTVIKRIARVREVLPVDLDDPDQRLAVQLACRVINL